MATKTSSSAKANGSDAHVTRIRATASKTTKTASSEKPKEKPAKQPRGLVRPLVGIGGYFAGAWRELREVRWPTRGQTWSMTGALVAFTAVFVILILLLDALFKYLFELILK